MSSMDKDRILNICGCDKDNPLYSELSDRFEEISKEFFYWAQPKSWMKYITEDIDRLGFTHEGVKAVFFCAVTIGSKVNEQIKKKFEIGAYMDGIMLDAICSAHLFDLSGELHRRIKSQVEELKLDYWDVFSPGDNLDMGFQKMIAHKLTNEITVNELGILSPSKTLTFVVTAGQGRRAGCLLHDCLNCTKNNDCIYTEKCRITILNDAAEIICIKGENLHKILEENNYHISVPCGKKGSCGRCSVEANGQTVKTCIFPVNEDISIRIPDEDEGFKILAGEEKSSISAIGDISIAADIGTTTCVLEFRNSAGQIAGSCAFLNPQRKYGTDVIARIKSASDGSLAAMSMDIKAEIQKNIMAFLSRHAQAELHLKNIVFAMNTVMAYLMLGENPEKLGVYPFKADLNLNRTFRFNHIFHTDFDMPMTIVPYISAFVGGDILSGIQYLNTIEEGNYLLADLGTNGELALKYKDRIYVTSAAAGPAFEGGNIQFGTGSVSGAVYSVSYNKHFAVKTIDHMPPKGICGSGLISAVDCFINHGFIDQTGLIGDAHFETGIYITDHIYISQNDIRQFQMAKSAVRAGIEILFMEAGIPFNEINKVYLAGGFGSNISLPSMINTGILPKEFSGKIETAGNTSLKGAVLWQNNQKNVTDNIVEINLSSHPEFNQYYIQNMDF